MGWLKHRIPLLAFVCGVLLSIAVDSAQAQVIISEFLASNSRNLSDEDGDYPDWIEVYNNGAEHVNLKGWALTDAVDDLTKWRFPEVVLSSNEYLIVFASGKNRSVPGSAPHTNFRLSSSGEYLALIMPDGATVASSFVPSFPPQVTDVSFGVPIQQTVSRIISSPSPANFYVPKDNRLQHDWTRLEFGDSDWHDSTASIGFENEGRIPVPVTIADSVSGFSGTQGQDGWHYGYYNKTADSVFGYQTEDFVQFPNGDGKHGFGNFWTGNS